MGSTASADTPAATSASTLQDMCNLTSQSMRCFFFLLPLIYNCTRHATKAIDCHSLEIKAQCSSRKVSRSTAMHLEKKYEQYYRTASRKNVSGPLRRVLVPQCGVSALSLPCRLNAMDVRQGTQDWRSPGGPLLRSQVPVQYTETRPFINAAGDKLPLTIALLLYFVCPPNHFSLIDLGGSRPCTIQKAVVERGAFNALRHHHYMTCHIRLGCT